MNKHFHIGITSLMTIFVVLCLVTFSLLSLSSSKANANYSQKVIQSSKDYFSLRNQAYLQLDQIQEELIQIDSNSSNSNDYFDQVNHLFPLKDHQYSFEISDKNSILQVTIQIDEPMINQPYYTILSMNKKNKTKWENNSGTPILFNKGELYGLYTRFN